MASSLSEDEFQRMQLQLLELRTSNYQFDEQCKRKERELVTLRDQVESLDKELRKANKTLLKSKKAKEFDQLMQEVDTLQRKIFSQEEEFRLQNETLMQELGSMVTVNENLEKENKALKASGATTKKVEDQTADFQDEVRRLQAQNSALQKNLTACQESYQSDLAQLKQTISDLETQCVKLAGQRGTPVGAGSSSVERTVEGQSTQESLQEDQVDGSSGQLKSTDEEGKAEASSQQDPELSHHSQVDDVNDNHDSGLDCSTSTITNLTNNKTENINVKLEQSLKQLNDLRLCLDTEQEEKRLLKGQLSTAEKQFQAKVSSLQEEVEKLTEKFKKKQESLVALQEEKERMYSEMCEKLEDTTGAKDAEISRLKDQVLRLQEELQRGNESLQELQETSKARVQELEGACHTLKGQVDASSAENTAALREQNMKFQEQLAGLQRKLDVMQQAQEDLQAQLAESQRAQQTALQQLNDAQQERDRQIQALQEASKVAEKRKALLDELAIKYQSESDQHREQLRLMEDSHSSQLDSFNSTIDDLKGKETDLELARIELEETRAKVTSLENTKGWLERHLTETEEALEATKTECEASLATKDQTHQDIIQKLEEEHSQAVKDIEDILEGVRKEKEDLEENIVRLKQEIQDGINAKKIHEKKGASMLKDLKRQLQAERKRAEKLQERLQEVLSDTKNRQCPIEIQSMEELFRPIDPNDRCKGDSSSISSWSASGMSREVNGPISPGNETPPSVLEQENNDLLSRIADVQQEKWNLEEKVSHLEASNSAMAEDILRKTAMIEYYAMDTRSDHVGSSSGSEKMTLKRVVDFVKDRGDENLKDINRKLQRMLEETLTKNMHLQKDLEMLSEEVVRLSKLTGMSPSQVLPPSSFQ